VGGPHRKHDLDAHEPDQATGPGRRRAARRGSDQRRCQDHQDHGGEQVGALVVHSLGFRVLTRPLPREPPEDGAEAAEPAATVIHRWRPAERIDGQEEGSAGGRPAPPGRGGGPAPPGSGAGAAGCAGSRNDRRWEARVTVGSRGPCTEATTAGETLGAPSTTAPPDGFRGDVLRAARQPPRVAAVFVQAVVRLVRVGLAGELAGFALTDCVPCLCDPATSGGWPALPMYIRCGQSRR